MLLGEVWGGRTYQVVRRRRQSLFNSTRGSILAAVLWHASFNFVTASKGGEGLPAAVAITAVIVWAVALLFATSPAQLSRSPKVVPSFPTSP